MHLPPFRAFSSIGSGLTGAIRFCISASLLFSKTFLQSEISLLSSILAAEVGIVFLKNVRSSVLMDRFIGGRNMASSGIEIWRLKNAPAQSIEVEFLSIGVLVCYRAQEKRAVFLESCDHKPHADDRLVCHAGCNAQILRRRRQDARVAAISGPTYINFAPLASTDATLSPFLPPRRLSDEAARSACLRNLCFAISRKAASSSSA